MFESLQEHTIKALFSIINHLHFLSVVLIMLLFISRRRKRLYCLFNFYSVIEIKELMKHKGFNAYNHKSVKEQSLPSNGHTASKAILISTKFGCNPSKTNNIQCV